MPMVDIPEELVPAFDAFVKAWRVSHVKHSFNHSFNEFIKSGYVKPLQGATMLLEDVRAMFNEWRINNDMGKAVRWSEDLYRIVFAEYDILVEKNATYVQEGEELHGVTVVHGLHKL